MRPNASIHAGSAGRDALLVLLAVAGMLTVALIALLANATVFAMTACAQPVERYVLSGQRLDICDLAGTVRVVQGAGARPEVIVNRRGPDASKLRVTQDVRDGVSRLHVVFPGSRVVYPRDGERGGWRGWGSRTTLRVGADGCLGHKGHDLFGAHRVTIAGAGAGLHAWADIEVRLPRGCETVVRLGVGEMTAAGVEGDLTLDVAAASVTAERTSGKLVVDTGSGHVSLSGNRGDISVDTGSGGVDLTDLRGSRVKVDTGSGGVSGHGVEADDLLVDTGSGGVEIDGVRSGSVGIDTGSGSVRVSLLSAPRSLMVDTGSGGVTVIGPADLDAEVELDTGSGGIQSDYAMVIANKEHGYLRGTIGEGRGRIKVDTGSGGVSLRKR